jgi:hypothetical protein
MTEENPSREELIQRWKTLKSVTLSRWKHENYILNNKDSAPIELYESKQRRVAIEEFLSMMRHLERNDIKK